MPDRASLSYFGSTRSAHSSTHRHRVSGGEQHLVHLRCCAQLSVCRFRPGDRLCSFETRPILREWEREMSAKGESQSEEARDFFISYTGVDQAWAEWIAWELEEAGYTTILQAWDFDAGAHFVTEMHRATQVAKRTIAVLSHQYLSSGFAEAEWQEAWKSDPTGDQRKLIVLRVEDCPRPGLLGQLVSIDLFRVDQALARSRLLAAVRRGRRKPPVPPGFPLQESPTIEPPFPGQLLPADVDAAMAAGGPLTADNPFAVAFAFWYSVLEDRPDLLDAYVTPESHHQWNLAAIRAGSEDRAITTAVMKPCYDVAYVRVIIGVEQSGDAFRVAGGLMAVDAHVISLVLRPELGGWRVHSFGEPSFENLPRTWSSSN